MPSSHPNRIPRLLLAVLLLAVASCRGPRDPDVSAAERQGAAVAVLEEARAAASGTRSIRHRFEFGERDSAVGWAEGETLMLQRTDLGDSLIRVTGLLQTTPGESPVPFLYTRDSERAWSVLPEVGTVETAAIDAGGRSLGTFGVYGYLPEYVEERPFWKELDSADAIRLAGERTVGGVECDVVEVVWYDETSGTNRYEWYLGRHDRLPRGMRWQNNLTGPDGFDFLLYDVAPNVELSEADFVYDAEADGGPSGAAASEPGRRVALGEISPDWALVDLEGREVRLSSLRGRVVVLDFWNTWCFICRNLLPRMDELVREYAGQPVEALAVNVFETVDPRSYWRERGYVARVLLDGDAVAQLYDVPWQPAVVVIGPESRVLLNQLGGSHDRAERVRTAVERGLERIDAPD